MQGLQEYALNPKIHHRRMIWNKIAKRFKGIRKHATGVVLCGPDPVDAECMQKVGFNPANFVFFDLDEENVRNARSNGLTTFHGNVFEYLLAARQTIDILHLDFCCGFRHDIANNLIRLMLGGILADDAVCYMNLQRGRDEGVNGFFSKNEFQCGNVIQGYNENVHRGKKMIYFIFQVVVAIAWHASVNELSKIVNIVEKKDWDIIAENDLDEKVASDFEKRGYSLALSMILADLKPCDFDLFMALWREHCMEFVLNMNHETFSYKSNVVYMDSALFNLPNQVRTNEIFSIIPKPDKDFLRRVAACKAVQTSRQK